MDEDLDPYVRRAHRPAGYAIFGAFCGTPGKLQTLLRTVFRTLLTYNRRHGAVLLDLQTRLNLPSLPSGVLVFGSAWWYRCARARFETKPPHIDSDVPAHARAAQTATHV
jgi:hypothetical protein